MTHLFNQKAKPQAGRELYYLCDIYNGKKTKNQATNGSTDKRDRRETKTSLVQSTTSFF